MRDSQHAQANPLACRTGSSWPWHSLPSFRLWLILASVFVLSFCSPLPAPASDSSEPITSDEREALRQIFDQQLELTDTLKQQLTELQQQNEQLQLKLSESQRALRASRATLQQQTQESRTLNESLGESKQARQALSLRLKESADSLSMAQASLAKHRIESWIVTGGVAAAGLLIGGLVF